MEKIQRYNTTLYKANCMQCEHYKYAGMIGFMGTEVKGYICRIKEKKKHLDKETFIFYCNKFNKRR